MGIFGNLSDSLNEKKRAKQLEKLRLKNAKNPPNHKGWRKMLNSDLGQLGNSFENASASSNEKKLITKEPINETLRSPFPAKEKHR
ncbi:MAG: hypothetical protein LBM95_08920 [Lactobacillales bacterium]|jgi:hypothetical protein|nr:hypothetical protein [Lactobacillales bacterium]